MFGRSAAVSLFFALVLLCRMARADDRLEEAKQLFGRGNELRKAGDCAAALDLYLRSRALVPSAANTLNAAFCSNEIGRTGEADELYQAALGELHADLTAEERAAAMEAREALAKRLGSVSISANVAASLFVDERPRGALPRGPVRLSQGDHVVRITAEGRVPFRGTIAVRAGETRSLAIQLAPLPRALTEGTPELGGPHVALRAPEPLAERRTPLTLGAVAGVAIGSGLGSGAEADCEAGCDSDVLIGGLVGARFAFESKIHLGFDVLAAFVHLETTVDRSRLQSFDSAGERSYAIRDHLRMRGPLAAAGPFYRLRPHPRLELDAGARVGLYLPWVSDTVSGSIRSAGPPVTTSALELVGSDVKTLAPAMLVLPELRGLLRIGAGRIGSSFGALIQPLGGPALATDELRPLAACRNGEPSDAACTRGSRVIAGEAAFGPFAAFVYEAQASIAF